MKPGRRVYTILVREPERESAAKLDDGRVLPCLREGSESIVSARSLEDRDGVLQIDAERRKIVGGRCAIDQKGSKNREEQQDD